MNTDPRGSPINGDSHTTPQFETRPASSWSGRVSSGDDLGCSLPPPGWWCSRAAGHEGPCAARCDGCSGGSCDCRWFWSPERPAGPKFDPAQVVPFLVGLAALAYFTGCVAFGYAFG